MRIKRCEVRVWFITDSPSWIFEKLNFLLTSVFYSHAIGLICIHCIYKGLCRERDRAKNCEKLLLKIYKNCLPELQSRFLHVLSGFLEDLPSAIFVCLVTEANMVLVCLLLRGAFCPFYNFWFSSKTKIEMNILILEYSNKSGVFYFHSMRRRFRVQGI